MPDRPDLDILDDDLLRSRHDPGTLERGRRYAAEGRVDVISTEDGAIKALCRGSGRTSYVVWVRWSTSGGRTQLTTTCTCPVGGSCKHGVATILTARRAGSRPLPTPWQRHLPDWRRTLAGITTPIDADLAEHDALALQVVLQRASSTRYGSGEVSITLRPMRRGRAGRWIKTGASWSDLASPYQHRHEVDPLQRAALRSLMTSGRISTYGSTAQAASLALFGTDVWYQLRRAIEVGVALVGQREGDVVVLAPERAAARVDLTADAAGTVTVTGACTIGDDTITIDGRTAGLLGTPPHGLWVTDDAGRLVLAELARPMPPALARLMAEGIVVPPDEVDELLDVYQPALARHAEVVSPDGSVTITERVFDCLVLHVDRPRLETVALAWSARYRRGARTTVQPLVPTGGRALERDVAAEDAAISTLALPVDDLPQLVGFGGRPRDGYLAGPDAIAFFADVLPRLLASSAVDVIVSEDQPPLRPAVEDPLISLTVTDAADRGDGNDWFDLGVEVSVDGEVIDFVALFTALTTEAEALILPSGTWLRLDRPEFERLRILIAEAQGLADPTPAGLVRINRFQTSWWDELAGLGVVAAQSARWAERIEAMAALAAPTPVPPPPGLDATLRHYQQEGLDWLAFLHRHQLGGILADDMGLGKTVQTLALCLHILETKPDARFLVVAPTSVVENWAREAARFAPGMEVRTIRETAARRGEPLGTTIGDARLVVTSYALFRLEFDDYAERPWELLLLDEAQFVKNHHSKAYQCARRLDAATKIAITGTPLENSLMDLWSLLSIAAPGLYPDPKRFADTYRKPIESGEAPELLATLRRRIAPLMRRRTKDAVLTELPPKTEQVVEVELSARHARIYQTQLQRQRQKVLGLVGDVQKHRFEILKSLTILRQLALDPGLVDEEHDGVGSAKLDRLLDDLTQVVAEGHRALVFSQFTRYLARARERLDAAGIEHAYLDGRTRRRDEAIARFKDGDAPVFVISLKAGGFGLNLTEADYCFVLDPWWNPATETQAVDRAHRMGQQNPVMVYRYVSVGTIEEKVMELKARKADLFDSVVDGEGALSGALTEDDIRGLLDLG